MEIEVRDLRQGIKNIEEQLDWLLAELAKGSLDGEGSPD